MGGVSVAVDGTGAATTGMEVWAGIGWTVVAVIYRIDFSLSEDSESDLWTTPYCTPCCQVRDQCGSAPSLPYSIVGINPRGLRPLYCFLTWSTSLIRWRGGIWTLGKPGQIPSRYDTHKYRGPKVVGSIPNLDTSRLAGRYRVGSMTRCEYTPRRLAHRHEKISVQY